MTTPKNKQEHIEFIAYYLIDKIQPITTKDIESGSEYWGGYEYHFKYFPELYNYKYLWTPKNYPKPYKTNFVMTKYTLTTLKNMLKLLDIDVEYEYACFKNKEERFHLEYKIIMKKLYDYMI
jgi:hypothetical protein